VRQFRTCLTKFILSRQILITEIHFACLPRNFIASKDHIGECRVPNSVVLPPDSSQEPPGTARSSSHTQLSYPELLPLDDLSLMREVQVRNGDALAVLFNRYYSRVLDVALRILHDRAEAEDVLQTIFIEIYQHAGQFDSAKGKFYTWLMQYAYHRSINRKNYLIVRQFYGNVPVEDLTEFDQGVHKLYSLPSHECRRFVHQALALLSEGQKRTIEMVHFEGLTLKEIAEKTDQSFPNVRHHYYRGLAKLKIYLRSVRYNEDKGASQIRDLGVTNAEV
jgi:RNA polymerase sigma-70 factor (ECF subfamily)